MLDSLHLHLKTDQRPNGTKISAVEKIEYINREGKYKDIDNERLRQHDIFQCSIFASNAIERHLDREQLLYESPFGKIKQTTDGKIMVSKKASVETVAIALSVAMRIYGKNKLTLEGDHRFYGKVIVAGSEIDLPLTFENDALNLKYQKTLKEYRDERTKYNASFLGGSRELRKKDQARTNIPVPYPQPGTEKTFTTSERLRMPILSKRIMEIYKTTRAVMLLHRPERILLDNGRAKQRDSMRWVIYRDGRERDFNINSTASNRPRWHLGIERRKNAEETAKRILINLRETLDRTYAYSHIQYINREAAFQKRGGCVGKGHSLPKWAQDDPKRFFEAADIYERSNGERYKEIEFALPNELPFEAQKEIVENFIQRELPNHYYAYAIHDKIGQMSDGAHNVHVHIMFTTRENDEYEKKVGRDAKTFFSRANSKKPEKGGCPKADKWNQKDRNLILRNEIRPAAAEVINDMLVRYGFNSKISEKSLKTRKAEAEKNGDTVLAQILDRTPEEHLDLKIILRDDENVDEIKQHRKFKKALAKDIYAAELMKNIERENKLQKAINPARACLDWLLKHKNNDKKILLTLKHQLNNNLKSILWTKNSYLAAAKKFMSLNEKKQFENFLIICQTKTGLERMIVTADEKGKKDISIRLDEVRKIILRESSKIRKIFARLRQQKLDILKEQRLMMQNNKMAKIELIDTLKNIKQIWVKGKENRKKQNQIKRQTYTMSDIRDLLMEQYHSIKKPFEIQKTLVANLKKDVISYERAVLMAEGQFTGGAYKKLRANLRKLEKSEKYLWHDKSQYEATLTLWEKYGERSPYKKSDIDAQKQRIDERFIKNHEFRYNLKEEQMRLEKLCSTPTAKAIIHKIALGIMANNQPVVQEYEKAVERLNILQKRLTLTEKRITAVRQQLRADGDKMMYKTSSQQSGSMLPNLKAHKDAQTIADGLLGKSSAIPKVMQSKTGEDDDWSMLTESAKAEKMAETRFRENW